MTSTNSTSSEANLDPYEITLTQANLIGTTIYYIFLLPVSVIGNLMNIIISAQILSHRKSIPDLLILSLALCDLLNVVSGQLPAIVSLFAGEWLGGNSTCSYQYYMIWSCLKLSFLILVLMAIDRYIALCKPLYYRANIHQKKIKRIVIFFAFFSFGSTAITVIFHSEYIFMLDTWYLCINTGSSDDPFYIGVLAFYGASYFILLGIFIFCNIAVVRCLRTRPGTLVASTVGGFVYVKNREKRFAEIIVRLSVVLVLTWSPYLVTVILRQVLLALNIGYLTKAAEDVSIRFVFANTAFNPIIIGIFNQKYSQGYRFLFRRLFHHLTLGYVARPDDNDVFLTHKGRHIRRSHGVNQTNNSFSGIRTGAIKKRRQAGEVMSADRRRLTTSLPKAAAHRNCSVETISCGNVNSAIAERGDDLDLDAEPTNHHGHGELKTTEGEPPLITGNSRLDGGSTCDEGSPRMDIGRGSECICRRRDINLSIDVDVVHDGTLMNSTPSGLGETTNLRIHINVRGGSVSATSRDPDCDDDQKHAHVPKTRTKTNVESATDTTKNADHGNQLNPPT